MNILSLDDPWSSSSLLYTLVTATHMFCYVVPCSEVTDRVEKGIPFLVKTTVDSWSPK